MKLRRTFAALVVALAVGFMLSNVGNRPGRSLAAGLTAKQNAHYVAASFGTKYKSSPSSTWPRILYASGRVNRKTQAFVVSTAKAGSSCALSLAFQGEVAARTSWHATKASGETEYLWVFPNAVPNGSWVAAVTCRGRAKPASALINLIGAATAGAAKSPRITFQVVAVQKNKAPVVKEPPGPGGGGGTAYPPYGSTIIPGAAWFGGHGVDVKSNGSEGNPNGNWQCVELFERFINAQGWYSGTAGAGIWGAWQLTTQSLSPPSTSTRTGRATSQCLATLWSSLVCTTATLRSLTQ